MIGYGNLTFAHEFLHVVLGSFFLFLALSTLATPLIFGKPRHYFAAGFAMLGASLAAAPFFSNTASITCLIAPLGTLALLEGALFETQFRFRSILRILGWLFVAITAYMVLAHHEGESWFDFGQHLLAGSLLFGVQWKFARNKSSIEQHWRHVFAFAAFASQFSTNLSDGFLSAIPLTWSIGTHITQCTLIAMAVFTMPLLSQAEGNRTHTNRVAIVLFLGLLFSTSAVWVAYNNILKNSDAELRLSLLQRAKAVTATIPARWLDSLEGNLSDVGRLEQDMLRTRLLQVVETQLDIRYAYVLSKKNGELIFLTDVEPRQFSNPENQLALPGDPYNAPAEFKQSLNENQANVVGPYQDIWGSFVSALVPINSDDEPMYLLGLDITEANYQKHLEVSRRPVLLTTILLITLFALGWFVYLRARLQNMKELNAMRIQAEEQEVLTHLASQNFMSLRDACIHATQHVCETLQVDSASVWLFEDGLFRCSDIYLRINEHHREGDILHIEDHDHFRSSFLEHRQSTLLRSVHHWTPKEEWQTLPLGIEGRIDTAILQEGLPIGFIRIESETPRDDWRNLGTFSVSVADLLAISLEREIRRKVAEEHATQTLFLQTLLDSLPVAVTVKAANDTRYIIWNQCAERLLGISSPNAVNRSDTDLFHPTLAAILGENDFKALQSKQPIVLPQVSVGEKILSLTKTRIQGEQMQGVILTLGVDITEQVAAERSLQEAYIRLEESAQRSEGLATEAKAASQAKSQFLASMSHEIRTPMSGVLGMLRLLTDSKLSEEQREFVDLAGSSAESLLTIINEILDFSRIESGRMQLDNHPFEFRRMIHEITRLFDSQAKERGIELVLNASADIPESLVGDSTRFRQILTNLIGNAIKFTPKGSVQISVQQLDSSANKARFHFEIKDSGIGIPQDKQAILFHPFTQADNTLVRRFGGTGLGLAISKHLVEMMDGNIGLTSIEGQGSTFWFDITFQLSLSDSHTKTIVPSNQSSPKLSGKILVAEDNSINQKLIVKLLDKLGLEAQVAGNGKQALELLSAGNFDLVLMDIQMPVMDGLQATEAIRKGNCGDANMGIPIIALTAMIMSGDRTRCLEIGMNDYLSKPVQFDQLRSILQQHLRNSKPA